MKFIRIQEGIINPAKVEFIHNMPELLNESEKANGYIVDTIPEADAIEGKYSELYFDNVTNEFSYQYIDVPKTSEQIILEQQERIEALEAAMLESLLGGN